MKPIKIAMFAGIGVLVAGVSFISTSPGIEKITIGIPLTVSGMLIVGIIALFKSKIISKMQI